MTARPACPAATLSLRRCPANASSFPPSAVVQGFAHAANMKFRLRDEVLFPIYRVANYCSHVLPFFNVMSSSWLSSEDPEVRAAAFLNLQHNCHASLCVHVCAVVAGKTPCAGPISRV